jgi:hypothetical protein
MFPTHYATTEWLVTVIYMASLFMATKARRGRMETESNK